MTRLIRFFFLSLLIAKPTLALTTAKELFLKTYAEEQGFARFYNCVTYHTQQMLEDLRSSSETNYYRVFLHNRERYEQQLGSLISSFAHLQLLNVPHALFINRTNTERQKISVQHALVTYITELSTVFFNEEQRLRTLYLAARDHALSESNPFLPAIVFGHAADHFMSAPLTVQSVSKPPHTVRWLWDAAEIAEFGHSDIPKDTLVACLWYQRAVLHGHTNANAILLTLCQSGRGFTQTESTFKAKYTAYLNETKIPVFQSNIFNVFGPLWSYRLTMFFYPLLLSEAYCALTQTRGSTFEYAQALTILTFISWFGERVMIYTPDRPLKNIKSMAPLMITHLFEGNYARGTHFSKLLKRLDTQLTTESAKAILESTDSIRVNYLRDRLTLLGLDYSTTENKGEPSHEPFD